MTQIFYSASLGGFISNEDRELFELGDGWPSDAIAISDRWYRYLMKRQGNGSEIIPNEYGQPVLRKITQDYQRLAISQRDKLIQAALASISVIQLKLYAKREISEAEKNKLERVLNYLTEIEGKNVSSVSGLVEWPPLPVTE